MKRLKRKEYEALLEPMQEELVGAGDGIGIRTIGPQTRQGALRRAGTDPFDQGVTVVPPALAVATSTGAGKADAACEFREARIPQMAAQQGTHQQRFQARGL